MTMSLYLKLRERGKREARTSPVHIVDIYDTLGDDKTLVQVILNGRRVWVDSERLTADGGMVEVERKMNEARYEDCTGVDGAEFPGHDEQWYTDLGYTPTGPAKSGCYRQMPKHRND